MYKGGDKMEITVKECKIEDYKVLARLNKEEMK